MRIVSVLLMSIAVTTIKCFKLPIRFPCRLFALSSTKYSTADLQSKLYPAELISDESLDLMRIGIGKQILEKQ